MSVPCGLAGKVTDGSVVEVIYVVIVCVHIHAGPSALCEVKP